MDIVVWLRSLGLGKYEAAFRENDIGETVLPSLTHETLKDLGVTSVGHRVKLLDAIAALRSDGSGKAPAVDVATASSIPSLSPEDRAERRQVTVMFSDLVGSTALSARMDPEDLREVISAYQKCVADTVQRSGGLVAKYMGDGALVYFGYPHAHEDDAERAVRAGLELVAGVGALKTHALLQTRVGIATGMVVVGDLIGSGASQEQAIVGETPNLAARLQGIAEPNSVVIAESTRKLVGNLFELEDLGARDLKGIAGPVWAWAALRPSSVESRFEAMHASGLTELVGREEEIELLLRRWWKVKTGEGQVVLLSGEPGIGKSRLTAALMERLAGEPHTQLRYFCSPQYADSALHPIIGQMERAAGFAHDDTAQVKLDKLDALLAQSFAAPQDAAMFVEMLSLKSDDGRYPTVDMAPEQRRQKTLQALTVQLEALSQQKPVLMIFEDAHWADPTSLEAFGRAVDRLRTLRVLLIVTHRPEFEPPWVGRPYVTALILNRLGGREIAAIIDSITGNKLLAPSVRQDIIERTDGIPLFVEEMTKAVLEAETEGEVSQTTARVPPSAQAVPASLHASLMARLDRLGDAKNVTQIGAAIGREFSFPLLAAVANKPEAELVSALDRLIAAGLLFRQGVPPYATYLFKHGLVQDAAYGTLLREPRRALHGRIAETLETRFAAAAEPELIARHLTEAGRIEQAIDYWLTAGQRAMQQSAHIEAERHLRAGLGLLSGLPDTAARDDREITLQNTLGVCLMPTRGFGNPEVTAAFTRAAEISTRIGNVPGLFVALRGNGQYHMISGNLRAAANDAHRVLALAEEVGNRDFLMEAHHLAWSTFWSAGDFRAAQQHADEGISRYERERDHHLTYTYSGHDPGMCARAYKSLSLALLGYPDQSLAWCRDMLALAEALAHPFTLGIALWVACGQHQLRREPDAFREFGERMIRHGTEKGLGIITLAGNVYRGEAMTYNGEFAEGIAQMREGINALRSIGTLHTLSMNVAGLAEAYARCGNIDDGLATIEEAFAMTRPDGEQFCLPEIHRVKGELLLARSPHDRDAAEAAFGEALSVAGALQAKVMKLRAAMSLARLWRDQGKTQQARELLAPVYGWFTEGFDTRDLKEAKALLEELA
jgi:class 3 adenylate cyclase/predicted ATPase